jgi:hypothetical protein
MTDYIITDTMLHQWRSGCYKDGQINPNNDNCRTCRFEPKSGPREGCCEFDEDEMEKIFRSRPLEEHNPAIEAAEERGYNKALDEFGILHGEDARKFIQELKNSTPLTPKALAMVKRARELAGKGCDLL